MKALPYFFQMRYMYTAWQSVCVSRCRGPHGRFLPMLAVGTFQPAVDNPVVGTFQSAVDRPFLYSLFQVRTYAEKKKSAGGKLVDATAETDAEIKREMEKIAKNFGGEAGADMTKFPDVKFENPAIEVPDLK